MSEPSWTDCGPVPSARLPLGDPCVVVIFGASGDLTRRKLIPALYHIACADRTAGRFEVVGIGRDEWSTEVFRARTREGVEASSDDRTISDEEWVSFARRLHYFGADLTDPETYRRLRARLEELRAAGASANTLYYCSTPPSLDPAIVEGLKSVGLESEDGGWSRIIIEKPFGHDLASARDLNAKVAGVFAEHQIYRIDHYLGKETVQNILVFRFGNSLFEPVWNRNYVDYVEITASEPLGVGGRAGYYEGAGALRDMVANHLLQLLTLTAMEPPVAFDADSVREEKVQILRSIMPHTFEQVAQRTVRGQYGPGTIDGEPVPGYRQEPGVAPESATETYVAVQFNVQNWRWAGVPFYLRSGKRLARHLTEVNVHFKPTPHALFMRRPGDTLEPNIVTLRIQPDEAIRIVFDAKRPGAEMHTGAVQMDFGYQQGFGLRLPAAYETLLLDAMQGDATLFTRRDEVENEWKLITPILEAWAEQPAPEFPNYEAGSAGPAAADELLARNGHMWRDLCASPGTPSMPSRARGRTGVLTSPV